ncbi:divergent PAP2 family protein [Candidatus Woesearchaeota archaeon]|nr:divergent PAP2 family protein [Candidatus Woesearchaeota archaeon]
MLKELIGNKILLAVLIAGLGVQLIKILIYFAENKKLAWKDIVVTGGMPSSHSAFVTSLVTIIYLVEGITTSLVISLVLAAIVIRDAFGVRRSVGEEGLMLSKIAKNLKLHKKLHYAMGHTPAQVLVGGVLGVVIAYLVYIW